MMIERSQIGKPSDASSDAGDIAIGVCPPSVNMHRGECFIFQSEKYSNKEVTGCAEARRGR